MGHVSDEWGLESVDPSHTSSSNNSSFKRVVHRVNSNAKCRLCLWVAAFICSASVIFLLIGYDAIVEKVAVGQMVLQEGGAKYEAWQVAPMPVYYKVTVFNLTNPKSFMAGARPRLSEHGPYVYRMLEEKLDVKFHNNDTVSYRTKPVYIFEPSLSGGSEDDIVCTVNIPLVNAADAVKKNKLFKTFIQVAQKLMGFQTLRKLKVRELLWGYDSHVMDWARQIQELPYPHPQFGLLVGFNNTPQEPYSMYTGNSDPTKMNKISSWNQKTKLDFWFGEHCNRIVGTDASGFHPNVQQSDTLYIFNGQLCRSIPLVFDRTVIHKDIEAYRFVPPTTTFEYGSKSPENSCFCSREGGCPRDGLLDMKPCYWGAAVAFSFPHFYQADPVLKHVVLGLRPDPELHQTQFDIYPSLGIPLRVKLRMQMNIVLDASQAIQRARHYDIIFPVFWFEAGIDSLPGEMVGMLQMAQNVPPVIKTTSVVIFAALTIMFVVLLLASSIAGMCSVTPVSRSPTPEDLPEHVVPWHTTKGILPNAIPPPLEGRVDSIVILPFHPHFISKDLDVSRSDSIDGILNSNGDPPAYPYGSPSMPDSKGSSATTIISAEIHTSASDDSNDDTSDDGAPVVPEDEDDFQPLRSSSITVNEFYSEEVPERVTPTTPPPALGTPIIAPLAKSETTLAENEIDDYEGEDHHESVLEVYTESGLPSEVPDTTPKPLESDL